MEARFVNGSTVNRLWGDNQEGELIAAFQYELDAIEFAQAKLIEDSKIERTKCSYVVASMQSGKIQVFRPGSDKKAKAA